MRRQPGPSWVRRGTPKRSATPTSPKKAAIADRLGLPPAKRCLGRQLRVHVRTPDHAKLTYRASRAYKSCAKAR